MARHWKYNATRCAVIDCERTRVKGWSTCNDWDHHPLGKSLYGAGRIEPIECPPKRGLDSRRRQRNMPTSSTESRRS